MSPTPAMDPDRLGRPPHVAAPDVRGFSLIELMIVVAVLAIIGAMAVPSILTMMVGMRVSSEARLVERELQTARLRAVATNRAMRVRFDCPSTGKYRLVEVIGTPSVPAVDDGDGAAATRCGLTKYPWPDSNLEWFDHPNNDGPLNTLDYRVRFAQAQTLEFWPDGTVHTPNGVGNPWPKIPVDSTVTIRLQQAQGSSTQIAATERRIEVNGVGKVTLQ